MPNASPRRARSKESPFEGEVELDESYFGGQHKGKQGRSAAGKVADFGIFKRDGRVYTIVPPDLKRSTLMPIIRRQVRPDSVVYTDGFPAYDTLDVAGFEHHRIDYDERIVSESGAHIDGIENFWRRPSGIFAATTAHEKVHFDCF